MFAQSSDLELFVTEQYDQAWDNQLVRGEDYELELVIGRRGSELGELLLPGCLEIYNNELFVVDTGNFRIQVFSLQGEFLRVLDLPELRSPVYIRFFSENIYVIDKELAAVLIFSPKGQLLEKIGGRGVGEGLLNFPNALAIDAEGLIWVSDERNNRVDVFGVTPIFSRQSYFLMGIDQYQAEEYLLSPKSICYVAHRRQVYVVDSGTARILSFDAFGNFIGSVLDYAAEKAKVFMPQAIVLDNQDGLYVADHLSHTIMLYTAKGQYRGNFGHASQFPLFELAQEEANKEDLSRGAVLEATRKVPQDNELVTTLLKKGSFQAEDSRLRLPSAICVQDDGDVWVSDWGNNMVKKFSASFYRKALSYYKKRDFSTAIAYFEKCNHKNEHYHLVEFYLAMCHYYQGSMENIFVKKIEHFNLALRYLNVLKLKGEVGIIENRNFIDKILYYLSQVLVYTKDI